ncbi:MAG: MMPL family transporter [Alphaproteobacteria bacterium]|nr:MMPL family transporter [Alphaproteobacteria bacterium]
MLRIKPYLFVFLLLLFLVVTGVSLLFVNVNHNVDVYFSPSDPVYKLSLSLSDDFPDGKDFVFLFEGDDLLGDAFLERLTKAIQRLKKTDTLERAVTLTTSDHIQGSEDGFTVTPLFDPDKDFLLSLQDRKAKIFSDRFAPGTLISKDAKAVALLLRPIKNSDTAAYTSLRKDAFEILEQENLMPYFSGISGTAEMNYTQLESMFSTQKIFIPLIFIINIALIMWMFPRLLVFIIFPILLGIATQTPTFFLVLSGQDFTMIHTMAPSLMSALCVALLIHYFNRIKYFSHLGIPSSIRAYRARDEIIKPAAFAALTTAAGLASLAIAPLPPIQSFGLTSAAGIGVLFFVIMYLLPPIMAKWDPDKPWVRGLNIDMFMAGTALSCSKFAVRNSRNVLIVTSLIMICGAPFLLKVKAETNVFSFYGENHRINRDTRKIEQKLVGVTSFDILLTGQGLDSLKTPEALSYMIQLQKWLDQQDDIDFTMSYAQMVEQMNEAFHSGNPQFRAIPHNPELISQYLFITDSTDLYDFVNRDFDKARIRVNFSLHSAEEINILAEHIKSHLRELPPPADVTAEVTGFGTLYVNLAHLVVKTQVLSLFYALLMIFFFMVLIFRSIRDGFLCMFPNIAPVLIIFILMGVSGVWLDMGTAMIASVGVGIAVDDTIHLFNAYRRRLNQGNGQVYSLMRAYQHEGKSVMATTFVLVSQFMVLGLSDFAPIIYFGLLSAVGVTSALVFDLLVLPALVIATGKPAKPKGRT